MDYSNPEIPEGINTSPDHPLKEFFQLTLGVIVSVAVVIMLLGLLADKLAHHIPFSAEQDIELPQFGKEVTGTPVNAYLNTLTQRVVKASQLPNGMTIKVHYIDSDTVNAYATLGGHIAMFRGLMEKLPNENALTMVLAHEVAHVKHRHPIRSVGRGIVIGLALSLVSSSVGNDMVGNIVSETGQVTALKFNRDHEHEADATALQVVREMYGHVQGAEALFHVLEASSKGGPGYEFLSTHPMTDKRIQRINKAGPTDVTTGKGEVTALPSDFNDWFK